VLSKLDLWADAGDCWEQAHAVAGEGDRAPLLLALWRARITATQLELAKRLSSTVGALPGNNEFTATRHAYEAMLVTDRSIHAAGSALKALANGAGPEARIAITEAIRSAGFAEQCMEQIGDLAAKVCDMVENAPRQDSLIQKTRRHVLGPADLGNYPCFDHRRGKSIADDSERTKSKPRAIFCAGFLWSGSGAVVDYLAQFEGGELVSAPSHASHVFNAEFNVFRRFFGASYIFDTPFDQLSPTQLAEFVFGPVLGLHVHVEEVDRISLWKERSLWSLFSGQHRSAELLSACQRMLGALDLSSEQAFGMSMLDAVRTFCNWVVVSQSTDGKLGIWNNCVQAYFARTFSILDDILVIAVTRDPRDQYVAQYFEWSKIYHRNAVEHFVRRLRAHQEQYQRTKQLESVTSKLLEIRFEDFVFSEEERERVLTASGVGPTKKTRMPTIFDPAASQKNVGIHQRFEQQDQIRTIEREFPDLLVQDR
jgi:hypothetical protein